MAQYLVPTAAERAGNLSDLTIPNTLLEPGTNQPFPNNTIPSSRLNSSAMTLLNNYYPLPNAVGGDGYNYEKLQPIPSNTDGADLRIDHRINSKQQLFLRYNWKNILTNIVNPLLPNDVDSEHDWSFLVSHSYAFTPKLLNEFRFGFANTLVTPTFPIQGAAAIQQLGLQDVNVSQHPTDGGFPTINFSDGTGFTPIGRDKVGSIQSSTKEITDNISYSRGRHTFAAGSDIRWLRLAVPELETPSDDYGLFTFNQNAFTGNAFGDLLVGLPNTTYFATTGPNDNAGAVHSAYFVRDEWQASNRLTINAGLRWELQAPFTEKQGIMANFDPQTNSVIIPDTLANGLKPALGFLQSFNACSLPVRDMSLPCTNVLTNSQAGLSPGLRQFYKGSIDPRIGMAYRPFNDNKTVLRAGFGIYTVTSLGQLANNNLSNPQASIHTFQNEIGPNRLPIIQFPNTIAASVVSTK